MKLVKIKAFCEQLSALRNTAVAAGFHSCGTDEQEDTYFRVNNGILKIRDAEIEKTMIFYDLVKKGDHIASEFTTYNSSDQERLKRILTAALGTVGTVRKTREIFQNDNVVLHLDVLEDGRQFVEIEVLGEREEENSQVCRRLVELFGVHKDHMTKKSYFELVTGHAIENA